MNGQPTVAIIGSFKQHNSAVKDACRIFRDAGVFVTSPLGVEIIKEGIPFVRFTTDNADSSDPEVQVLALHRIFRAQFVYVVAPSGYVGRTTCYEIGRVLQARRPIYFSARPNDLPIWVPNEFILSPSVLAQLAIRPGWQPTWLYENGKESSCQLERHLLNGQYKQE